MHFCRLSWCKGTSAAQAVIWQFHDSWNAENIKSHSGNKKNKQTKKQRCYTDSLTRPFVMAKIVQHPTYLYGVTELLDLQTLSTKYYLDQGRTLLFLNDSNMVTKNYKEFWHLLTFLHTSNPKSATVLEYFPEKSIFSSAMSLHWT